MSLDTYIVRFSIPNAYGGLDSKERVILTSGPNDAIKYVKNTVPNPEKYQNFRVEKYNRTETKE